MKYILLSFIFVIALHSFSSAETVILNNGQVFQGKIVEKDDKHISLKMGGAPIRFSLESIETIEMNTTNEALPPEQKQSEQVISKSKLLPITKNLDTSLFTQQGKLDKTADMNKDGKDDHWWYSFKDGYIQKIVRDLDFDGQIDSAQLTYLRNGVNGEWEKMVYDNNNDGIVDAVSYYDNSNKWTKQELDSDMDGKLDTIFYSHGKALDKVEADFNNDGVIDMNNEFVAGNLTKSDVDSDFDGSMDKNFDSLKTLMSWLSENRRANNLYPKYLMSYFQ